MFAQGSRRLLIGGLQLAVHIGALLPLLWLFHAVPQGYLGGDPVEGLIHFLGIGALRLLLLSLLVSPLARWLRNPLWLRLRRPLGLWCFAWASLHLAAWMAFDLAFEWRLIGSEIVARTYLLVGFVVWLVLAVLAVTSLPWLVRRLGQRWKPLHRWIYPAVLLACLHFWWSQKSGWIDPAIYTALAGVLLAARYRHRGFGRRTHDRGSGPFREKTAEVRRP